VKIAKKCAQRWDVLFAARDGRRTIASRSSINSNDDVGDAFDCSDLIVPPSHELINREVEMGIERWKDLASRVIVEEEDGPAADAPAAGGEIDEDGSKEAVAPPHNHELLLDANVRGDRRKQRLMPHNFDYACKNETSNGSSDKYDDHCPKVVSLLDPTKTLNYGEELWNVFKSMNMPDELERVHAIGDVDKESDDDDIPLEVLAHGCQHTLGVKRKLKEGLPKYSRLDAHSLGRLRIRDRHSDPVGGETNQLHPANSPVYCAGADISSHEGVENRQGHSQTTLRFEILRHSQNLKRGSGSDGNRMEVELHGSLHTLLVLHRFLVECALNRSSYAKGSEGVDTICAGVFFIENTFYTCGEVGDQAKEAIERWLDGEQDGPVVGQSEKVGRPSPVNEAKAGATFTPRRYILGLSPCQNTIPMSKMKLEDLPLRLGVRYFHMFVPPPTPMHMRPENLWSLANESAVYVAGIHTHRKRKRPEKMKAPIIIHDTWAAPQRHFCLACNYSLASIVTINSPLNDAAPPVLDFNSGRVQLEGVPMCSSCYQALHYRPSNTQGGENDVHRLLELRPGHQSSLVFPIDDYQRMTTASSLDKVLKSAPF